MNVFTLVTPLSITWKRVIMNVFCHVYPYQIPHRRLNQQRRQQSKFLFLPAVLRSVFARVCDVDLFRVAVPFVRCYWPVWFCVKALAPVNQHVQITNRAQNTVFLYFSTPKSPLETVDLQPQVKLNFTWAVLIYLLFRFVILQPLLDYLCDLGIKYLTLQSFTYEIIVRFIF